VKRYSLTLLLVCALAAGGLSTAGYASTSAPTSSKDAKHDPCAAAKSKWARTQCEEFTSSAPGDEYFGRMKMSYLGIDNTFKDGVISAGSFSTDPSLIHKLDFAAEALDKWAAKYPNDPQLPRSYFFGIQVLRKIYTEPEQERAWRYITLLVTRYKNTYFGKIMTADIAHGFTEHWFVAAQMCPTPVPKGMMAEATPDPTEPPSPAPGKVAVDLMTPPCIAPATPSPMPSGSALPSPAGSAKPSPSPSPKK
jgi:hypothetical protein